MHGVRVEFAAHFCSLIMPRATLPILSNKLYVTCRMLCMIEIHPGLSLISWPGRPVLHAIPIQVTQRSYRSRPYSHVSRSPVTFVQQLTHHGRSAP